MDSVQSQSETLSTDEALDRRHIAVLVASVFIVSTCAIFYELLISSLSSYLLGSTVLHFSLTIGLFLFFMGVGSYLSRFITTRLIERFISIELWVGIFGGLSGFILYWSFSVTEYYYLVALLLIGVISILIGLEVPIVTRIVRDYFGLKDALANILSFDYLGALAASILFPLVLLPYLGIMKTAFAVGIINVLVAVVNLWVFRSFIGSPVRYLCYTGTALILLFVGFVQSFSITSFFEKFIYQDPIVYASQTPYQRIILTKFKDDTRLFLNGNIQFSSIDEYRYHEALVHVPMSLAPRVESVLVLGGGDGLVIRELLKYPELKKIVLVDIDKEMVELGRSHPALTQLNKGALDDSRVEVVYQDAFKFLEQRTDIFSVMIIDLPDPNDLPLGKLYTKEFYELTKKRLSADGVIATQASSPYFARTPYWCVHHTMEEVFPFVEGYTLYIPSFGQWGFHLASPHRLDIASAKLQAPTRFVTDTMLPMLFHFDSDTSEVETEINRLDNQKLVQYYDQSWQHWN